MEAEASVAAIPTLEADRSIYELRPGSDIDYVNPNESQQMRDKYSKANKRLILLGEGYVSQKRNWTCTT
jgi:hypothetical protein